MGKDYSIFNKLNSYDTIVKIVKDRAITQPDDICFRYLSYSGEEVIESKLTYKELDKQSMRIATYLQSNDLTGKCVILLYPGGLDFIMAFFGCLYAKVIAVPFYHFISNRRISRLMAAVKDSEAKIFLSISSEIKGISSFINNNFPNEGYYWIATDTIKDVKGSDYEKAEILEDELAYLQYTSGSTSSPKGVMITHRNIMHNMKLIHWYLENTPDSVGVSWLPHFHDMGLVAMILQPMYVGYTQVLMQPADFLAKPYRFLKAISDYRATIVGAPNFSFDHCVVSISEEQKKTLDLSSIDFAWNGAEPVRWSTIKSFNETFKECGLKNNVLVGGYGLAEATLVVTCRSPKSKSRRAVIIDIDKDEFEKNKTVKIVRTRNNINTFQYVSVGLFHPDVNLIIVDPTTRNKCTEGKVGEIWLASQSVSPGYWKKERATDETFYAYISDTGEGPFLRTGDMGFMIKEELYISGRLKDIIIIRGVNYYPNDIEFTVGCCHPALVTNSCAAFSVTLKDTERLYIAQEVKRTCMRNFDPDEVFDAIRKAVVEFHDLQVHGILLLPFGKIPKTSSGKIEHNRCREEFLNGKIQILYKSIIDNDLHEGLDRVINGNELLKTDATECKRIVEKKLANMISSCLQIESSKVIEAKDLISLGIDSLSISMLKQSIEDHFLSNISIPIIYNSSLQKLAEAIITNRTENHTAFPRLPEIEPQRIDESIEFPLTDLQYAYWIGRNESLELGGIAAHVYLEISMTEEELDHERLNTAWQMMIQRHGMLRAVVTTDGMQKILDKVPEYRIECLDLRDKDKIEWIKEIEKIRENMSHQVMPPDRWPLFEIRVTKLETKKSIIHISIDLLIADIWSLNILFKEWYQLYVASNTLLPSIRISFRDYVFALRSIAENELFKKSEEYWKKRISTLPQAPQLSLVKTAKDLKKIRFHHRERKLSSDIWNRLKEQAAEHSITPSVLLMSAYSKILSLWSRSPKFTINVTLFNRLGLHPDINNIVGDFTSLILLEVDNSKAMKFVDFSKDIQMQLSRDMEHRYYSGVNVMRDYAREFEKSSILPIMPVVFTSALSNDTKMVLGSKKHFFGEISYV